MTFDLSGVAGVRLPRVLAPSLLVLLVAIGCERLEPISRYTVPKDPIAESPHDAGHTSMTPHAPVVASGPQRMLAAMLRDGERVWFFKVLGPVQAVAEGRQGFESLLASISLQSGQEGPSWELPEAWTQEPASGMRYATIIMPTSLGSLELTVTPLRAVGDEQDYMLANVNRWCEQLGLAPNTMEQLFGPSANSGLLGQIQGRDGQPVYFVDLVADSEVGSAGEPAESTALPAIEDAAEQLVRSARTAPANDPGLTYRSPENWKPGKTDGMRKVAFEVRDDSGVAEVTVIPLPSGSGDLLSNVNRWRTQVGLGPLTGDSLPSHLTDFAVHDASGKYVELIDPSRARDTEAILGVICSRSDLVWYFKMKGDTALVERERESFQEFVRSVNFAEPDGAAHGQ